MRDAAGRPLTRARAGAALSTRAGRFYLWVLAAIVVGGLIGFLWPDVGVRLKPLGDGFIALIRMLIAPVIFLSVVLGIAGAGAARKVGRVGVKAILYFEVVSTLALLLGLVVVNLVRPGAGFGGARKRSSIRAAR